MTISTPTPAAVVTTAQHIARIFEEDGTVFEIADGDTVKSLEQACLDSGATVSQPEDPMCNDTYRYAFSDGSALVLAGDAWDFEGAEAFSFLG